MRARRQCADLHHPSSEGRAAEYYLWAHDGLPRRPHLKLPGQVGSQHLIYRNDRICPELPGSDRELAGNQKRYDLRPHCLGSEHSGDEGPRRGVVSSRVASPHAVRRSLTDPLQSSALFGGVFGCTRSVYHRLTPAITKRRQIPFPQVGRSHNPLVAGSSPARPTRK